MVHLALVLLASIVVANTSSYECPSDLPWYCFYDNGAVVCVYAPHMDTPHGMDTIPTTTSMPNVLSEHGFEAFYAVAGLAAVVYLIGRKGA